MSPKEKAKSIVKKMMAVEDGLHKYPMCFDTAMACAIISVGETIDGIKEIVNPDPSVKFQLMWWDCVNDELNKMK